MKFNEQRKIYKIHSKQLKKANWALEMPLDMAMSENPDLIVSLNDSQVLRWIDELNGISDTTAQIKTIKNRIKNEKRKTVTSKTKKRIRELYNNLYALQFQKDYVAVVMDSLKDYDRANKGFSINGIQYRRFLGTNGGVKNSTIVYVNAELYPELKKRLDNGRNKEVPLVPAKLEAYQALICSGSTPIPEPNGIIVVPDCITHFLDDVITITDEADGEPILKFEKDFEIEHNDSDGYGLMLPCYSSRVNEYLTGSNETISGMNTRYSFEKGMLYTFDFLEFAEKVAGTYEIVDVWGTVRDVRNAEVILTASMLKLWDSYSSWEDYYNNCLENHYEFSTPKITPPHLENVRTMNYQFLQSYELTDEELAALCQPTINEISDVINGDYRKSIVFMAGGGLTVENSVNLDNDVIKALMIEPQMLNDPFVKACIYKNIKKKMELAKKGSLKINGNYSMISGDPYALCQSMFGLEITGLLKAGEIYHKYWIDNGDSDVVCFRAPMTCHNNIRKMHLCNSAEADYWYRYITTALIYNAWDTACDAMNGADKDGDTNMITNNPVLLKNTKNSPTIICVQRKAPKKIPTEEDLIEANKKAFNDEIGTVTNHITAMFEVQAQFEKDSAEYAELAYRIMCGQLYQQNTIDSVKGIIAKPMPEYWYRLSDKESYSEFQKAIVAKNKPYFMRYVYPHERAAFDKYVSNCNSKSRVRFGADIAELEEMEDKTEEIQEFLEWYYKRLPMGGNACTVNRVCWFFENAFATIRETPVQPFDYSILKSNVGYTTQQFNAVQSIYKDYRLRTELFMQAARNERLDKDEVEVKKQFLKEEFKAQCDMVCPNEAVLADIVLDLCYNSQNSKLFAWDMCGNQIISNLLESHNHNINIPVADENGEFEFNGGKYTMKVANIQEEITYERVYFK